MLLALVSPVLAGLLVNEIVYDPAGADGGLEWIELCNNGSSTVDLTGYQVQGTSSGEWTEAYTFASGSLAPGEYLVVGYGSATHTATFSPNLPNGATTAGVRVVDASSNAVDTVLYGSPNDDGFTEDGGTAPTAGADDATSGKSIGRFPDCADTNTSATDFVVYATADVTAGAANTDPDGGGGGDDTGPTPTDVDCTGSDGVTINELFWQTGEEYIELYNSGSGTVQLENWTLSFGTKPSSLDSVTIPAGTTLAPGAFFVVGSAGASYKDWETDLENVGNASSTDGVLLDCGDARVDTLLYEDDNSSDGWTDDSGATATSFAPKGSSSESVARAADGVDTDQCGVDFIADIPSPGISNTAPPVGDADCTGFDGIKINELVYTTDAEWIELYNGGSAAVALDAWVIQFGTSSYNKEFEIPDGTTLAVGDWLLLGTGEADIPADLDFGNASDTDAVRITCNGEAVDTVLYGDDNTAAWPDDSGAVGTSFAPEHDEGESLARSSDGYDTDQSGLDFILSTNPSPGAENPYVAPPVCESGTAREVKVNEFIYNPEGTDSGNEWVELYNAGDAAIRLDGWTLETAGSEWGVDFTFPTGVELAAGEYLLIGGDGVGGDYIADKLSIDNGSSGAGGVRIVDCEGAVIDTVLYVGAIEDPITGDGGSMEVVPETADGASLGRYPNGSDSDKAADWHPYGEPTPGAANTDPGAGGGGGGQDGCQRESGPPKPGEGCTTVLPFGGMEVALAAAALLRRRRRS